VALQNVALIVSGPFCPFLLGIAAKELQHHCSQLDWTNMLGRRYLIEACELVALRDAGSMSMFVGD
jgi:hypothetical protein